eukprot:6440737-Amphidinium_carterae.2
MALQVEQNALHKRIVGLHPCKRRVDAGVSAGQVAPKTGEAQLQQNGVLQTSGIKAATSRAGERLAGSAWSFVRIGWRLSGRKQKEH